ncbi:hypothetical protein TCAL_12029 [Tigriopus californicus]|uniref:Suppressor of forked domain-containing protein n=2 Tax=Tigriopus californicus TaxID=6832 RepID=A0A553PF45_TIGCA|nr:pre-mRNA-processing factor 39-like isoform X2 [Tigriopus californicus]TRY76315.1 hypothetical protein TCAL_12029 [Tigriopus californicus]|eukprot:TCALIF_12029-PA protein Name:"Similar to PRPF39 Pre-mRNA-processing factor 39 (Homo sapiens)" AED:0.00 eAED:0.00 QI:0/-1/0/1/-1/1/1/0/708
MDDPAPPSPPMALTGAETADPPPAKKAKVDHDSETTPPDPVAETQAEDAKDAKDAENVPDSDTPLDPSLESKNDESSSGKKERPADLAKFWKTVEDDPADFTGWTYLLQFVDANANEDEAREAYEAFLFRYPYCYGYWKKYADYEKRREHPDRCQRVFDQGLKAIPLSADLWLHYLNHIKVEEKDRPEFVRAQFERAVAACGREWRSDKLWDSYVKWEKEGQNQVKVMDLYDRILSNPTQGLAHQFDMFKDFVKEVHPKDMLAVDEFLALRKEVLSALKAEKAPASTDNPAEAAEAEPAEPEVPILSEEEENQALREKLIHQRKKMYKDTEEKSQERWKFEDQIKRPYFHMKPLERGQLKNWKEYLDHEITERKKEGGDEEAVVILFERCLIACALYEEFWQKYAQWLQERRGDHVEAIRDVYRRATTHHLPTKVDIHVQYAAFEEEQGQYETSLAILKKIQKEHPNLLSLALRQINIERRQGNVEAVHRLYEESIDKFKPPTKSDLAIKYSRFVRLHLRDFPKAKAIIEKALEADDKNPKLYLQILDIMLHENPLNVEAVTALFDVALEKLSNSKHQMLFSQRKVEFLEDFGLDIKGLQEAQKAHSALAKQTREAQAKADSTKEGEEVGSAIKTIEGRGGSKTNGTTTYAAPAANSAAYAAQHNNQYQQYGARYSAQYGQYGQYGSYYQGSGAGGYYGGSSGGTGGY